MRTPTHDEVAHGAHQIWQDSGRVGGRDIENWLQAEHRLLTASPEVRAVPAPEVAPETVPEATVEAPPEAEPIFNESYRDRAPAEAAAEQRQEARAPITPQKTSRKAKPPESGKPLWSQPHSR